MGPKLIFWKGLDAEHQQIGSVENWATYVEKRYVLGSFSSHFYYVNVVMSTYLRATVRF